MLKMKTTIHHAVPTYINWSEGAENLEWAGNDHPDITPFYYLRDIRCVSPYKLVRGEFKCPLDIKITIKIQYDFSETVETIVRKGS